MQSQRNRVRNRRSGIVLLVCLVMLVLFLLLAITFTLTATQFRTGAGSYAAALVTRDEGRETADAAIQDWIRGSNNLSSPFRIHSALGSLYGNDGIRGTLTANAAPLTAVGGQFVAISVNPDVGSVMSPISGYYAGCVMTMLDGPAAGQSRRIVDYIPGSRTFHVETFSIVTTPPVPANNGLPVAGNMVLINGRPFNGEGNGYNPTTGRTDAVDPSNRPYALLPNLTYFTPNAGTGYVVPGGLGGMDVGYTAPDYNNIWLAGSEPNPTLSAQIKPSFHDPALLKYWAAKGGTTVANIPVALLRQITFRPLTAAGYHPKFTGSNSFYTPDAGPWDVDTDGDGRYDAVWIDPGYPVRRTSDGRLYKALVAVQIRDLDGRVNLNVHGSLDTANAAYGAAVTGRFAGGTATSVQLPPGQGYGPIEVNPILLLSAGNAAELATASAQFQKLLSGGQTVDVNGNGTVDAAAGDRTDVGRLGVWVDLNSNGTIDPNETGPGILGTTDTLNLLQWSALYGGNYIGPFGTPWDVRGVGSLSLTHRGQPAFHLMGNLGQWLDSSYEQDYSRNFSTSKNDAPFTVAEAEGMWRQFDADAASLPNRLSGLCPRVMGFREELTVVSSDLPVPSLTAPRQLRDILRQNGEIARHITDLLRARLIKEHVTVEAWTLPLTPARVAQVDGEVNAMIAGRMISLDLLSGLRFDINRLLGNGLDDNANGIVDEPAEAGNEVVYPAAVVNGIPADGGTGQPRAQFNNIQFDHNGDGVIDASDAYARQQYAKQLYVLLMLLADEGAFPTLVSEAGLSNGQKSELIAQRLAQFAINCVDYRDQDGIMTPFEYDINPFNGWSANCDGIIHPDPTAGQGLAETIDVQRRVVWGCEAPTLLLSDNISFHNIRAKDDPVIGGGGDTTYDQFALPQGSTFIELYSPANPHRWFRGADEVWGTANGGALANGDDDNNGVLNDISEAGWVNSDDVFTGSRDLYTSDGRLDLSRKDSNGVPVWRIAISAPHAAGQQVSNLLTTRPQSTTLEPSKFNEFGLDPAVQIERAVWFCNANLAAVPVGIMPQSEKNKVYFNRADTNTTPVYLLPGRYLVVGPRPTTAFGKQTDGITDSNQKIHLNVGGLTVNVTDIDTGNTTMPTVGTQIQAPQAIVCAADRPSTWVGTNTPTTIGINISEPLPSGTYYPEPTDLANNDSKYTPVTQDVPLDDTNSTHTSAPTPASQYYAQGMNTNSNVRTMFLQRVANPTLPFHPVTNPFITVDFMPMDLTLFNGDAAQFTMAGGGGTVTLRSRERGNNTDYNIWAPATGTLPASPVTLANNATHNFKHRLSHTLGFLNNTFSPTPGTAFAQCITTTDLPGLTTVGDPKTPFPWITWFDRPYVSPYELAMVPASSPARLNFEFSNAITNAGNPYTSFYQPYRHLLDFFHTSNTVDTSPQLGRVFDYLCVPSKYPESNMILNPTFFAGNDAAGLGKGRFRPPFNVLSRYRETGRINLNTIFNPLVYSALGNGSPMPAWDVFVTSRRGYAAVPTNAQFTAFDTTSPPASPPAPSVFGNPFRAWSQWDLHPELPAARKEADVSMLRPNPTDPLGPLFAASTLEAHRNSAVHSYFRYQSLNRLGNLTTTRSNVFAVWVTVGYFEVEPNLGSGGTTTGPPPVVIDSAHPDGYQLTTELGIDTGDVRRHKSFYIIDRTIPVGYENGKDYNTSNTILLKTHIE